MNLARSKLQNRTPPFTRLGDQVFEVAGYDLTSTPKAFLVKDPRPNDDGVVDDKIHRLVLVDRTDDQGRIKNAKRIGPEYYAGQKQIGEVDVTTPVGGYILFQDVTRNNSTGALTSTWTVRVVGNKKGTYLMPGVAMRLSERVRKVVPTEPNETLGLVPGREAQIRELTLNVLHCQKAIPVTSMDELHAAMLKAADVDGLPFHLRPERAGVMLRVVTRDATEPFTLLASRRRVPVDEAAQEYRIETLDEFVEAQLGRKLDGGEEGESFSLGEVLAQEFASGNVKLAEVIPMTDHGMGAVNEATRAGSHTAEKLVAGKKMTRFAGLDAYQMHVTDEGVPVNGYIRGNFMLAEVIKDGVPVLDADGKPRLSVRLALNAGMPVPTVKDFVRTRSFRDAMPEDFLTRDRGQAPDAAAPGAPDGAAAGQTSTSTTAPAPATPSQQTGAAPQAGAASAQPASSASAGGKQTPSVGQGDLLGAGTAGSAPEIIDGSAIEGAFGPDDFADLDDDQLPQP